MKVIDLEVSRLRQAEWNSNQMDGTTLNRLKESVSRYGLVQNLVVRPLDTETYEVLSGNQRLQILMENGMAHVPCFVVEVDDANARLLSQALNHIQGEDDLGLRAELFREILASSLTEEDVLSLLPETRESLQAMASLGKDTIAEHLAKWEEAQGVKLKHLQFQISLEQLAIVEEALTLLLPEAREAHRANPNARGNALYLLCKTYLENKGRLDG